MGQGMRRMYKLRLFESSGFAPVAIVLIIALVLLGGLLLSPVTPITLHELGDMFEQHCSSALGLPCNGLRVFIGGYLYILGVFLPFILLFEYYAPAKKNQKIVSIGFRQDQVWFVLNELFVTYLLVYYFLFLDSIANDYLGFIRIGYLGALPVPLQITLVILCVDFLSWFSHFLRHHVPLFWRFHKIHHSPKEMNFFVYYRNHPVDIVIHRSIMFIPFFCLQLDVALPTFIVWSLFKVFLGYFQHSNVKAGFGPLRYIFVSPQYHRIHHSIDRKHRDKNFGSLFIIWDIMFRTKYLGFHEYPDTGISDKNFPHAESTKPINLIWTTIKQLVFPFRRVSETSASKTKVDLIDCTVNRNA